MHIDHFLVVEYVYLNLKSLKKLYVLFIRVDQLFAALRRAVPKTQLHEARSNAWISEDAWRLVDEGVSARRDPRKGQTLKRQLGRAVKASLAADQKRRADKAGEEVEALVGADPPLIQEAWYRIQG